MQKDGFEEDELNEYKRRPDCLRKGDGPLYYEKPPRSDFSQSQKRLRKSQFLFTI